MDHFYSGGDLHEAAELKDMSENPHNPSPYYSNNYDNYHHEDDYMDKSNNDIYENYYNHHNEETNPSNDNYHEEENNIHKEPENDQIRVNEIEAKDSEIIEEKEKEELVKTNGKITFKTFLYIISRRGNS